MQTASGAGYARHGKSSWYPQGSGNLPATLLPFRSSLFIVGRREGGGGAASLQQFSSVPRLASVVPMFFFDGCQSKYAWALSAGLRLHSVEVPDPANRLVHRVELPVRPQTVLPQGRPRGARAGPPSRPSVQAAGDPAAGAPGGPSFCAVQIAHS
ncbi:hypothetical protein EMIT0111MI5_10615 [Burkholderia sp. IT-111MI5]